ncbi:hypothetical protein B0J18DRAFT_227742 [Chaetomium sp. MPI-SDFR-AT-0129]|nr:hypothetical protein B0J18DRAFT_227742 [Chaetomium sp. MPI-SDFR-AT-0129]
MKDSKAMKMDSITQLVNVLLGSHHRDAQPKLHLMPWIGAVKCLPESSHHSNLNHQTDPSLHTTLKLPQCPPWFNRATIRMKFSTAVFTILSAVLASATPVTLIERQQETVCSGATPVCCAFFAPDRGVECSSYPGLTGTVDVLRGICASSGRVAGCCGQPGRTSFSLSLTAAPLSKTLVSTNPEKSPCDYYDERLRVGSKWHRVLVNLNRLNLISYEMNC